MLRRVFLLNGSLLLVACGTLLGGTDDSSSGGKPPSEAGDGPATSNDSGGPDGCDPGDADLATDPSHCGVCGRLCEDGVCTAGRCNAIAFANLSADYRGAVDIAAAGAGVFVAEDHEIGDGGGILRCAPVPGPNQTCTLEHIFRRPLMAAISADGTFVYYGSRTDTVFGTGSDGGVGRVAFDAAVIPSPATRSSVDLSIEGVDVADDGTQLYVANPTGLFVCPTPDCSPLTPVNGTFPSSKVVADAAGYCALTRDTLAVRCAANAAAAQVTIPGEPLEKIVAIAIAGPYLYWTSTGVAAGAKWSRRDGSANGSLPGLGAGSPVVAAVGEDVYAAIVEAGAPPRASIARCSRTSCVSATRIASSPLPTVTALAVLGPYLYFGARDTTARGLWRVAR